MKKILACLLIIFCICGCSKKQESSNPFLEASVDSSEIVFEGRYVDDLNTGYERSEMIIAKQDDGNYVISFGIYKLLYIFDATGKYNSDTKELGFEGTDSLGNEFAATIFSKGDYLAVKLLKSSFESFPAGTILKYYPEGYYPIEEHLK